MKLMLTAEEEKFFSVKKSKAQEKVDKSKAKMDNYQLKQAAIIEKQLAKAELSYQKKLSKVENLEKTKVQALKNKNVDAKIITNLELYFENRKKDLNEDWSILQQNVDLLKGDLHDGLASAHQNNIRINISTIEQKISKINFKRNWNEKINNLDFSNKKNQEKKELLLQLKNQMYEESDKLYMPAQLRWNNYTGGLKLKWNLYWLNFRMKWTECKNWSFKEWINLKVWTIPMWMYLSFAGIALGCFFTGTIQANMIYAPAILLTLAIISGVIFSKIPIWKKYFGGAVMGSMFVGAFLVYFKVIYKASPGEEATIGTEIYDSIKAWFSEQDFLSFYISVLLVGAVLLIPRKMIIKATGGFFLLIIIGTVLGLGLGYLGSLMTGMSLKELILYYALPILSDGNGGGIQPIGKIAGTFGYDSETWISRALAISTLASVMSVIAAAILNGVGKAKPSLSGEGKLMLRDIHTVDRSAKVTDRNVASALLLICMIYMLSDLFEKAIFTEERIKILVPNFAWMIIICLLLNLANIVPTNMKLGAEKINKFISKQTTWLLMVGVGILYIKLDEFINALNPEAIFISFLFVLGAAVGPMLIAKFLKFNAIESAVSAGLCMTAQGGSGAIAVLGSSERMELMPFGQITCRIAGSIVLIFAAIAFGFWRMN